MRLPSSCGMMVTVVTITLYSRWCVRVKENDSDDIYKYVKTSKVYGYKKKKGRRVQRQH